MRNKLFAVLLILVLSLSFAAVGMAQDTITPGTPIEGTFAGEEMVYTLQATTGQLLIASLSSEEFDPEVYVGQAGATITSDDDSGGDDNALLPYVVQADGTYEFTVDSWSSDAAGAFTLQVDVVDPTMLPFGETITMTPPDAETLFMYGVIEATADTVVHVNASTTNPEGEDDMLVELIGTDGAEIERDDDDGSDDNALIRRVVLPNNGLYLVKVSSYGRDDFIMDPVEVLVEQTERLFLSEEPQAMVLGDAEGQIGTEVFFIDMEAGTTYRIIVTIPSMPDDDVGIEMELFDTEFFFDPYLETRHTTRTVWEYTAGRTGQVRLDVHPNFFGRDISQIDYTIALEVLSE
jgi:hypothetical protein